MFSVRTAMIPAYSFVPPTIQEAQLSQTNRAILRIDHYLRQSRGYMISALCDHSVIM